MLFDKNIKSGNFISRLHAVTRLLISMAIAVLFYFIVPTSEMDRYTHILSGWDIFCLSMLGISWYTFFSTSTMAIREQARFQDESRLLISTIVLVATFASLLAVVLLLTTSEAGKINKVVHLFVVITGMAVSWMLVHTIFTFRYAHLYYGDHPSVPDTHAEGLIFPGKDRPDYLDFAYFSFVLGMTFQVSDINVSSRRIRRLALLHGLLSFGFNTIFVALTINIIAGLKK